MIIETRVQYEEIPNGSILYVVLSGDSWEEEVGKSIKCIKLNDKLFELRSHYDFSEHTEKDEFDDFSFIVIQNPGDVLND